MTWVEIDRLRGKVTRQIRHLELGVTKGMINPIAAYLVYLELCDIWDELDRLWEGAV